MNNKSSSDRAGLISGSESPKKWYDISWQMILATSVLLMASILTTYFATVSDDCDGNTASTALGAVAPFPTCNFGPKYHTHLIIPLATTESECARSSSRFFLSHGATFFCPHTWDIKLLVAIEEDSSRSTLCASYFKSLDNNVSPMHAFRPELPQGGLPGEANGQPNLQKKQRDCQAQCNSPKPSITASAS